MSRYRRVWFAALWCLIASGPDAYAQTSRVIVLQNADSLVGRVIDGMNARELVGNVHISQDQVQITCDRAVQMIDNGTVELVGNVTVRDDSLTITAPRGMYYRDARRAEAFGQVTLDDGLSHLEAEYGEYLVGPRTAFFHTRVVASDTASLLNADTVRYDRERRFMEAHGHVVLYNHADRVTISGGHFENDAPAAYSRMTVGPVLFQRDSSGGSVDTLIVRSRTMESYGDSLRRLVATDSVQIVRGSLAGTAGRVVFYTTGDSILLRKTPILWFERTQVTGDSITVYLRQRALDRIRVDGNAFALSQSDSLFAQRYDQLTGESLEMYFIEKKLQRIHVESRATSVYYLYEDSSANGLNKTSGDRIIMQFAEGRARSIQVVGGVEGQYVPEPLVGRREREYDLPGFRWHTTRPAVMPDDLSAARDLRTPRFHQKREKHPG